jgi:adenylate cyclase
VNVAARIEELTRVHGVPILLSEDTRAQLGEAIPVRAAAPAPLRGRSHSIQTYVPITSGAERQAAS